MQLLTEWLPAKKKLFHYCTLNRQGVTFSMDSFLVSSSSQSASIILCLRPALTPATSSTPAFCSRQHLSSTILQCTLSSSLALIAAQLHNVARNNTLTNQIKHTHTLGVCTLFLFPPIILFLNSILFSQLFLRKLPIILLLAGRPPFTEEG